MSDKQKITILGGGIGAMSAAFSLTSLPGWENRYDVTVYQLGWRLGGKGASGRNADFEERIEEHGLHIWYGYYENAFKMIRQAYEECSSLKLLRDSPIQDWRHAFKPHHLVTIMEPVDTPNGRHWEEWNIKYPHTPFVPGDGVDLCNPWKLLTRVLQRMVGAYEEAFATVPAQHRVRLNAVTGRILSRRVDHAKPHLGAKTFLHAALRVLEGLGEGVGEVVLATLPIVAKFLERFLRDLHKGLGKLSATNARARRFGYGADLTLTAIIGCLREDVLRRGFAALNVYDLKEWLEKHGARYPNSPIIESVYDGIFAYNDGDTDRPNLAASAAIQGMLRMFFTYKEAPYYKMQAGMGDTIFSPLYLLLKHRGVEFRFFHRVTNIGVAEGDPSTVDRIDFAVQAQVNGGAAKYNPLRWIKGVPCWPDRSDYSQLKERDELLKHPVDLESAYSDWKDPKTRTLRLGKHFDKVILAIPVGAHRAICPELVEHNDAWTNMLEHVTTTPTMGVQTWFRKRSAELGWTQPESALMTGFVQPADTWGDMSHLLAMENWKPSEHAESIHYFCGPLKIERIPPPSPGSEFPAEQLDRLKAIAKHFFRKDIGALLPGLKGEDGEPRWDLLAAPARFDGLDGEGRLEIQFFRVNIDPSELYVLSGKGSIRHRLEPGNSGYRNLYLAGDWTHNIVNVGCVEAAVSSGMECIRAMTGEPIRIIGDFR